MKIFLGANCSFRSFARIIKGLSKGKLYAGKYCPSYGTLINWLVRAAIAKLNGVKSCDGPCIDIMDHWIGKGSVKLFVVLRISLSKYKESVKSNVAPELKHFELIHLEVMSNPSGDTVCSSLNSVYKKVGAPLAIISDSGSDLIRAMKLINEDRADEKKIEHIEDLSHKVALILKKEYGDKGWFKNFFSMLGKASKKLHTGKYSSLKPPVQNDKARFMNIDKQIKWFFSRMENLSKNEFAAEDRSKFIDVYKKPIDNHRSIEKLNIVLEISHKIMKILKLQGMNEQSYKQCIDLSSNFKNKMVKVSVQNWLESQYEISQKLLLKNWEFSMPISSDPIESLFAKYKTFQKRAPEGDPTRTVVLLSLFVGENGPNKIHDYLLSISHKDAKAWVEENVPETIHKKKRDLSGKITRKKVPNSSAVVVHTERPYEKAFAA